jgi:hypothetical protein
MIVSISAFVILAHALNVAIRAETNLIRPFNP